MKGRRWWILAFILLVGVLGLLRLLPGRAPVKKVAREIKHLIWESDLEDAEILGDRVVFWDGDYLVSMDFKGKIREKVDHVRESLTAFFTEEGVFLYDGDLNKLYRYDKEAKLRTVTEPEEGLYNVSATEGTVVLHIKSDQGEALYQLKGNGDTEEFFRTDNFILSYDVVDPRGKFLVTELSTSAAGYKSTLYVKDGEMKKYDFPSEVIMDAAFTGKDVSFITEKNGYRISGKETIQKEIPIPGAVLFKDEETYLIHSGILSRYDRNWEEDEEKKIVLAANLDRLVENEGYLYGIGKGDIGGQLMTPGEFYLRLGAQMDGTRLKKDHALTFRDHELWLYALVDEGPKGALEKGEERGGGEGNGQVD